MSFWNKIRNKLQQSRGRGKDRVGRQTRDRSLQGRGKADRYQGGAKQVGERAKDAVRDIRKTFRR